MAGSVQGFADGRGPAARFDYPDGPAVDAQGNIYVADTANHRIQKLSPTGAPLAQWGTRGDPPSQFEEP